MFTKQELIAFIQAMPKNEFENIDLLLERLINFGKEKQEKNELQKPSADYKTLSDVFDNKNEESGITTSR